MNTTVLSRKQETPDTVTLRVAADMMIVPGQFIMLGAPLLPPVTPGGAQRELKRSYSVASYGAPHRHEGDEACADAHEGHLGHGGWIEVTIKEQPNGTFSRYAQTIAAGDSLELYGPFGRHFLWDPSKQNSSERLVWIAGGSGIAPFRCMLQQAIAQTYPGHIILVFSVRTKKDFIYADEMASWKELLPNLHITLVLTRPTEDDLRDWDGLAGRIGDKALRDIVGGDVLGTTFYVCGPTSMVVDVQGTLARLAVPSHKVLTEKYGAIDG